MRTPAVFVVALVTASPLVSISAELVRVGPDGARQPRLAASPDGAVFVAFGTGDAVHCSRSDDGGATFSEPERIGTLPGLMLGMRRGPRVAATGDAVVVTAISRKDGNLVSWRSTDRGETWSGPIGVNDADKACREGLHDTAAGADGKLA